MEEKETSTFLVGRPDDEALKVENVHDYQIYEGNLIINGVEGTLGIFAPSHWTYFLREDEADGN